MARLVQYDKNGNVILNRYNLTGPWKGRMRIAPDGKWMRYEDVAPFISEAGRTVRATRPVQQLKHKIFKRSDCKDQNQCSWDCAVHPGCQWFERV